MIASCFLKCKVVVVYIGDEAPAKQSEKNKTSSSVYDYVTPEVMSTVVGAALGDQDCLRYSACKAGNYVADVTGKEIVLM